jgi:hypothetical protein
LGATPLVASDSLLIRAVEKFDYTKGSKFGGARGVRLEDPVFSNFLGGLRDPKKTRRDVRAALDRAGFNWVTSHTLGKTTATMLDKAGCRLG